MGIYSITNWLTGERYIGESMDIEERWCIHKQQLNANKHHNYKLQNAWNKYGEETFDFEVLEELAMPDDYKYRKMYLTILLLIRENYYINKYDSIASGYNIERTIVEILNNGKPIKGLPCSQTEYLKTKFREAKYLMHDDYTNEMGLEYITRKKVPISSDTLDHISNVITYRNHTKRLDYLRNPVLRQDVIMAILVVHGYLNVSRSFKRWVYTPTDKAIQEDVIYTVAGDYYITTKLIDWLSKEITHLKDSIPVKYLIFNNRITLSDDFYPDNGYC